MHVTSMVSFFQKLEKAPSTRTYAVSGPLLRQRLFAEDVVLAPDVAGLAACCDRVRRIFVCFGHCVCFE